MALIQTSLIWVAYAVALVLLLGIAALFVYSYQQPGDRATSVTVVCFITVTALLATVLLLPVDVALVSATVRSRDGVRKDWATDDRVHGIVRTLEIVYYLLYSLDALLCLIAVPFTYFWYEENDEVAAEDGKTLGSRLWGAFKYTIVFIVIVIALFLVGFFVPAAKYEKGKHRDLDFFKHLLAENHGERALTFALGLLMTIGTVIYCLYTAAGLALLPITFIKSAPSISAPALAASTESALDENRERQRQLESRNQGKPAVDSSDRRELDALQRDEQILVRRQRVAAESHGDAAHWLVRAWHKVEAVFRPIKLIGGLLLIVVALIIFASMLITGVDKAKNSVCKQHCGYLLGAVNIVQPINALFVVAAKAFPVDYVLFLLLVVLLFSSSVVGMAAIGIRFLWLSLFKIRKGHTTPQAMLMATVLLTLIVLAINYSVAMIIAPQYATFGPQTYCDRPARHGGEQPDCTGHASSVKHCTELAENPAAKGICTPSVASTFINRVTVNFPFFGVVDFWAQFAFLAVFLITLLTALIRTPKLDTDELDSDLEHAEEEGLLASTGRRFNATWQDITGRARRSNPGYGTTD